MMTPFPKLIAIGLPRLPLPVVLLLVLGDSGRAAKPPVNCYQELCRGTGPNDCSRKPAEPEATTVSCESGYCFHDIREEDDILVYMERRCAWDFELSCLMAGTSTCMWWGFLGWDGKKQEDILDKYVNCEANATGGGRKFAAEPEPGGRNRDWYAGQICFCDKDHCNGNGTISPLPISKRLNCHSEECQGQGQAPSNCRKEPQYGTSYEFCYEGYCYQDFHQDSQGNITRVKRRCGSATEADCLIEEYGGCIKSESPEDMLAYQQCLKRHGDPSPEENEFAKGSKGVACVCDKDSCNDRSIVDISIQCYDQTCEGTDDCKRHPANAGATIVNCTSGHCFEEIQKSKDDGKITAVRRCATKAEIDCLNSRRFGTKTCMKFRPSGERQKYYASCIGRQITDYGTDRTTAESKGVSAGPNSKGARCVCDDDLCNGRISSGPTGVKRLGSNVALGGALLVAVFPLRRMFLVG